MDLHTNYERDGYVIFRQLFPAVDIAVLDQVLSAFFNSWQTANRDFYLKRAVNAAYLTRGEHLDSGQLQTLFEFLGSSVLMDKVGALLPAGAAFMNTQLFFNPHNAAQPNYWHRDPQYHLSLPQQKAALSGPEVLHFRVPVRDEPGIELIPGTHRRWDCEDELAVRLEQEGRRNCEALESGEVLPLQAGDLLVFSANMLHRGIYGENRLALDILFCEPDPALMQHVEAGCLPPAAILAGLEDGSAFHATRRLLNGGD